MKRLLDVVLSSVILTAAAPMLTLAAACIAVFMGRPVLFVQHRPGRHGKVFKLYKLRTMQVSRGDDAAASSSLSKVTPLGNFLRRWSIDELPQLWNVLKGDMSLVGPRPLLVDYLPLYTAEQARRHEVKPGLTGWAQVNGRNAISWEDKFAFDVWYVEHQSLVLDLRILFLTLAGIFKRDGINAAGDATMPKFGGSGRAL